MKIFSCNSNPDIYQSFTWKYNPEDEEWFDFHGKKKGIGWQPAKDIYILNPMDEQGDFLGFIHEIVLTKKAIDILWPVLAPCCELLDFEYEGETYTLANVLEKGEYLDHDRVTFDWVDLGNGEMMRCGVDKKIFDPSKMPECSVFRVEELNCSGVYTYEGVKSNREEEFKYVVEKHNLKGLYFREIWDSEANV